MLPECIAKFFKYKEYKGVCMFRTAEVKRLSAFKVRDSDIWVCSFPRSGTTLIQEMTYLVRTRDFDSAMSRPLQERCPFIDVVWSRIPYHEGLAGLDKLESPRMIKSHFHHFLLPEELKAGTGKIVYVARNPKSVVVSLFRLLKYVKAPQARTLEKFVELFLKDKAYASPWWLHVREFWERRRDSNVLFLLYEDVIKDRRGAIKQIADFLEQDLTEADIDKIMEHTDIDTMRDNKMVNFSFIEEHHRVGKSEGKFINTGQANGWKEILSPEQEHKIEAMLRERLGDTDLTFSDSFTKL